MPTDDQGRAFLLCSECESPVYHDPEAEAPHQCSCDEQPSGYVIPSKSTLLEQLAESSQESNNEDFL